MKWLLILMVAFAVAASAADITGTWKGTTDTPNGPTERTFIFKVDGSALTGETSGQRTGKSEIADGKIDGDSLSFTFTVKSQGKETKLRYTGKVNGNEIKFHVERDAGPAIDYTVKKVE